ncbi:UvrD/REP helicase [Crinalium epipsammum PCC 9333]|uniref:DNA 3'-5' helicase n=1 Tax=Crinalium epipsammum PCC 9333 TaxID=1173022 RepID=K9W363_9CYAN|nr:ATP-dependent helicase [Crinalium epipsammum]AFZ14636.1 UvrD/REP helicase [Crinalium epipsammum PCC 9333]
MSDTPDHPFTSPDSKGSLVTSTTETVSPSNQSAIANLRQQAIQRLRNNLRPGQQSMADWQGGSLAVSAVPGAGKSTGMAVAAAIAIARYQLNTRKQLIIVTFTRSAAANIKAKIRQSLRELSLPQTGFAVHTLHGLALNIASRYPDLSALNLDTATIISPNQNHRLIRSCVEQWIAVNSRRYNALLEGNQFDGEETERLRRQSVLRTEVLPSLANIVIREAKSSGLTPQDLWLMSEQTPDDYGILAIAAGLYEQYENSRRSRDFIDYDDMILAALRVLENDSARKIWQDQVFAVFEDEAQDSSPLQTKLLEILATDSGSAKQFEITNTNNLNLVRVGDPNQAINSTFTPADPIYFRSFCSECSQIGRLATMDQAGRSSRIIIDAANFVLNWVNRSYGGEQIGSELSNPKSELPFSPQNIRPVNLDDPQQDANPAPTGRGLEIYKPRDVYDTVKLIGKRVIELFAQNPEGNAAVLVRENRQGSFIAEQLHFLQREHGIEVYDVAQSNLYSHVPAEILAVLQFLDRPHSPDYLKAALEVFVQRQLIPTQDLNALASLPEQFLYPGPLDPPQTPAVRQAGRYCRSLLRARLELPHYQLISFLALTLNYDQSELATADKLAERIAKQTAGNGSLSANLTVLSEIVNSEKFEPVEAEDSEGRYLRKGQLTIITMHKAKGLDWDYVFIPFLHEDTLPGSPWVPTAAQFLGEFTLAEVARAQIRAYLHGKYLQPQDLPELPVATEAWQQAARLKSAEEYRLLYVAMTRAKRLLWMAAEDKGPFRWNTFNHNQGDNLQEKKPCPVIPALKSRFPNSVVALSEVL